MASRKEQKEKLRQERLRREQEAKAAEARKRMVGYGAAGAVGVALLIAVVLIAFAGGGGDEGDERAGDGGGEYPSGSVPEQKVTDLKQAAKAAGCELKQVKATGRKHVDGNVNYGSNPPTSGNHFPEPAQDGAYTEAPPITQLVHTLEHGRIVVWFNPGTAGQVRGSLKALFDEDPYQMVLTPDTTKMSYQVAATAWGRDPQPLGRGYLLGCERYSDRVPDAIRAFRDEHRSNGPEPVP